MSRFSRAARRFAWIAVSEVGVPFAGFLASCLFAILALTKPSSGTPPTTITLADTRHYWAWLFVLLGIGFLSFAIRSWSLYRDRVYGPTLAYTFQDRFDALWPDQRTKAAHACLTFIDKGHWEDVENSEDLEDVLDFLEDLGFYLKHKQIGVEVLHHHFHHWIRIYWEGGGDQYVAERRRIEPSCWNHVKDLFDQVTTIEAEECNQAVPQLRLGREQLKAFLQEEIGTSTAPSG